MPNPLIGLEAVFELIGREAKVLPATGHAFEDLEKPDIEEIDEMLYHKDDEDGGKVSAFAESPEPDPSAIYFPTPKISRNQDHLFRFFVDGSFRTYMIGTGVEGTRSYPIQLAQIGGAVVYRNDDGSLKRHSSRFEILLVLAPSDTLYNRLKNLENSLNGLGRFRFRVVNYKAEGGQTGVDYFDERNKAGGKIRHEMHLLEVELIDTTDGQRNEDSWLILDGAVKLADFINKPYMIGVAKSFSKNLEFHLGRGRGSRKLDITSLLAGLPHEHRTAAFSTYGGKVAFWFVRLREQKEVDYPLMGVVKVEMPVRPEYCDQTNKIRKELIDRISSALVAERNVCPYGADARWHCHLYPIYIAEKIIKTGFYSKEVLTGAIRWPKLQEVGNA